MQKMWFQPLSREDPVEKETATHSNTLAWEIITEKKLYRESVKWRVCGAMSTCTKELALALVIIVCVSGNISQFPIRKLCHLDFCGLKVQNIRGNHVHHIFTNKVKQFLVPSQKSSKLLQQHELKVVIMTVLLHS